jgi:signal transduction histidine kinase
VRRRLILSTALIAVAAVIVLGVPLGAVDAARLRQDSAARLEREADAVAGATEDRAEAHLPITPELLRRLVPPSHRIVMTTSDGSFVASRAPLTGEVQRAHAGPGLHISVVAEAPRAELDRRILHMWLLIAALAAGGVATAVALAAMQARRFARPLEAVAHGSARLGDGDFSVRVGRFGVPEIDAVARALDRSAERIAALVAREREFSANASHQLRTPLTALRLRLEELEMIDDPEERARELKAAIAEADRFEGTIADLLAHARAAGAARPGAVDVGEIAREHARTWRPVLAQAGRALDVSAPQSAFARASAGTVGQVLDVLLDNALRHGEGPVRLEVRLEDGAVVVSVTDRGPGVEPAARERIFERGASRAGGTGIGLHLARALAETDGGSLVLADCSQTRFDLRLPLAATGYASRASVVMHDQT